MTATVTSIAYRHPSNAPASIEAARIVSTFATRSRRSRPPTPTRMSRNATSSFVSLRKPGDRCAIISAPLGGREPPQDGLASTEHGQIRRGIRVDAVHPEHPPSARVRIRGSIDRLDEDRTIRGRPVRPAQTEAERPRSLQEEEEDGVVPGVVARIMDRPPCALNRHRDGDPAREAGGLWAEGLRSGEKADGGDRNDRRKESGFHSLREGHALCASFALRP